jgi:hypothetical protein
MWYVHSKRNSLRTGDPENSGFNKIQLRDVSIVHATNEVVRVYSHFKKYDKPILLCSKNFGRNLDITPLGGNAGIAASERGNVCRSLFRRSSNSEYRFRMRMDAPYMTNVSMCSDWTEMLQDRFLSYTECLHPNVPHDKGADARLIAVNDDVVVYMHTLCPARLVLVIPTIGIILESNSPRRNRFDRNVWDCASMRVHPVWWRCHGGAFGGRRRYWWGWLLVGYWAFAHRSRTAKNAAIAMPLDWHRLHPLTNVNAIRSWCATNKTL